MPILENVTTNGATQVWASPDGQRKIFAVTLDYQGKPFQAKTYSQAIATVGWSGTVEGTEKPDRNGNMEMFVKQPPKEGFTPYSGGQRQNFTGAGGSSKTSSDPFTMYLSYAKDLAIASIKDGQFDGSFYAELLDNVITGGKVLYDGRPGAEPVQTALPVEAIVPVDKIFDVPSNPLTKEDFPWPKS